MTEPPPILVTILHELQQLRAEVRDLREAPPLPPVADPVTVLRVEAETLGIPIVLGGFVAEGGAALLLGRSKENLKYRRQNGKPIARPQKLLGRWCYSLADIAEITPEQLEEFEL